MVRNKLDIRSSNHLTEDFSHKIRMFYIKSQFFNPKLTKAIASGSITSLKTPTLRPQHRTLHFNHKRLQMGKTKSIVLDGRTGEGGGQLVRLGIALAALTSQSVEITNVRGNRPRGGGESTPIQAVI